ncbi:surface lipoprotein assembly modifier [Xenorhabdus nematophila]|uniref:surface lipoprotein assembly modifier n=1 Tax=Xenorhabdus nematophila TaxID=628 RepID=UPI001F2102E8|nr:surface lipoprotein assembly modifier [Xenorhabdus nematophila]
MNIITRKKHLNGDINFVSGSLIFIPFNDLYMSLSGSYSVTDRRSKEDSHHDKGMTFLISKRFLDDYLVELNYQKIKTDYIGKTTIYTPAHIFIRDLPPIKIKREDITDSVSLSLSNESINLFGFYPTLSFSYTKNKSSNLFLFLY